MTSSKLKAGVLQLTLFIAVIIALLLGAFILVLQTNKIFNEQKNFTLEAVQNVNNGLQYFLAQNTRLQDTITLKNRERRSIKGHIDFWGMYQKIYVSAEVKNKSIQKIALVGATSKPQNRTALYLEEHHKPLVLVGDTKIQGIAYLPSKGVKTGNINGHSYYQNQLIDGVTKTSNRLQQINKTLVEYLIQLPKVNSQLPQKAFLEVHTRQHFYNSFKQPLKIIYDKADINLYAKHISGHILIQSETKIIVHPSTRLRDVILIAPVIVIKDNVRGTFQALAKKQIILGKNCNLKYPSALVLLEGKKKSLDKFQQTPSILIQEYSNVEGLIVYMGDSTNHQHQVFVATNSCIKGEVYCNQNLELSGTVYGTVYTSSFVSQQNGYYYQNHLYNGKIIEASLPYTYIGLLFETSKKGVAQWIY